MAVPAADGSDCASSAADSSATDDSEKPGVQQQRWLPLFLAKMPTRPLKLGQIVVSSAARIGGPTCCRSLTGFFGSLFLPFFNPY
jgi:hypothetical protein